MSDLLAPAPLYVTWAVTVATASWLGKYLQPRGMILLVALIVGGLAHVIVYAELRPATNFALHRTLLLAYMLGLPLLLEEALKPVITEKGKPPDLPSADDEEQS